VAAATARTVTHTPRGSGLAMTLVEPNDAPRVPGNPSGNGWWTATRTAMAAGSHPGLEPLTHDLQAEFAKTAERAQVRSHEGRRQVAPIGLRGMSRCRHAYRVD